MTKKQLAENHFHSMRLTYWRPTSDYLSTEGGVHVETILMIPTFNSGYLLLTNVVHIHLFQSSNEVGLWHHTLGRFPRHFLNGLHNNNAFTHCLHFTRRFGKGSENKKDTVFKWQRVQLFAFHLKINDSSCYGYYFLEVCIKNSLQWTAMPGFSVYSTTTVISAESSAPLR